ncbi:MAG: hypothetical protein K1W22_12735 [Lachnospiraceae bacterium]
MANRELRKLNRRELLQILLAQCEETERLQQELDNTQEELEELQIGYERLKKKLDIKDERLNIKDAKIAELTSRIKEIQASRLIELSEAGSIAEASLRLNGIFEAAQRAAEQYLMNVKRLVGESADHIESGYLAMSKEQEIIEQEEIPRQLAVPEERVTARTFTISDRRGSRGQKIPYESGWRPVARRKKLHG